MDRTPIVNCWDHTHCTDAEKCPAYPGRGWECWNVEGTLCRGEKQGGYHFKIEECRRNCPYYDAMMHGRIP